MSRRADPTAMRRRIIEAAIGVFARLGFHRATTEDVATAAGLAKGTLYLYFGSKEDILLGGYELYASAILDRAAAESARVAPASIRPILALVRAAFEGIEELKAGYPLYFEVMSLASHPRVGRRVKRLLETHYRRHQDLVCALLRGMARRGELRPKVNIPVLASAIGAFFDGYCVQRHFSARAPSIRDTMAALETMLVGVVQAKRSGVSL